MRETLCASVSASTVWFLALWPSNGSGVCAPVAGVAGMVDSDGDVRPEGSSICGPNDILPVLVVVDQEMFSSSPGSV